MVSYDHINLENLNEAKEEVAVTYYTITWMHTVPLGGRVHWFSKFSTTNFISSWLYPIYFQWLSQFSLKSGCPTLCGKDEVVETTN